MHQASLVTVSGLVNQLLLPNSGTKSPYWENGRVMLYKDICNTPGRFHLGQGQTLEYCMLTTAISPQTVTNQTEDQ